MIFLPTRLIAALVLSGAVALPAAAQTAGAAPTPEPVVNSALDGELFYRLISAEMLVQGSTDPAAQRNAFQLLLLAARETQDERIYERATRLAIHMRSGTLALQASQAWRTAHPLSLKALVMGLDILVSINRLPESVETLKQAYAVASPAEQLALMQSIPEAYVVSKDKARLAELIEQALPPHRMPAQTASATWVSLGRLYRQAQLPDRALDAARRAASLTPESDRPLLLAAELIDPQRPLAEAMVKTHLASHPKQTELRLAYARALLLQDKPSRLDDARSAIREVIAQRPEWPVPHLILGTIEGEQRQDTAAEKHLQDYLRLSEASGQDDSPRLRTQALLMLSSLAQRRNDPERALYWLDRIDNAPDPLALHVQRASILARQGQIEEALKLLEPDADDSQATSRRKLLAQAQLLRDSQQAARAHQLIADARAKGRADPELIYEQAMLAEKLGRHDAMEKLLVELMAIKPDDHAAYNALGFFLADHNLRLHEAKTLIEKALSLVPGDPYVTDSLGWVEFRLGNLERARSLLEQAFESKPDAEIGAHLGEVYWAMGDKARARAIWTRARQIDPLNEALVKTLQRLDPASR
jgi:predicted Zn-dependent protease